MTKVSTGIRSSAPRKRSRDIFEDIGGEEQRKKSVVVVLLVALQAPGRQGVIAAFATAFVTVLLAVGKANDEISEKEKITYENTNSNAKREDKNLTIGRGWQPLSAAGDRVPNILFHIFMHVTSLECCTCTAARAAEQQQRLWAGFHVT